ncbi:RNA-guided endonuclease InsQ/TnpB family protein [Kitasatospora aureofaciens]|uniref:Transposase n=1 Tax=Kitasatospora aureofaciens TaxID=1894 RepID=A0A1E7MW24_KITAU|nr:RNA-guided endonuclease TnpB family protein [Kitasatospora aureofaciens]QEU99536.1 transposase [Streptomyces viridifaciens]ARF78320.1 transposase [Kitasatospora aureofaciens]OEV32637.1 transposase [Kitasatospora aureofaciens]UKZ05633.1 transposase [Streptomyces viridifaciens]GGU79992.1 transposase [Kitasatospora aureofaciens]
MKIVVRVRLEVSAYQADALAATLRACNRAANHVSRIAFDSGEKRRNGLQPKVYRHIKDEFDLSAQPACRVVKKVCDAYATLNATVKAGRLGPSGDKRRNRAESKPISFREYAAQAFDDRCLSWNTDQRTVSIWTVSGRLKGIRFTCSDGAAKVLAEHRRGESDLVHRDGRWYLFATCDVPAPAAYLPSDWLGVDLGIVNIATTSDGTVLSGRRLERYRKRMVHLRAKLQMKKTKSAKRRLKALRRREQRFATDTNHSISKTIVTTAERTSRGIALEDLTGIRERVKAKHDQRYRLHSWAFAQLGAFVEYKAKRAGVPVVRVNPAHTSRQCSACWHTHRHNRVNQAAFACRACGTTLHADVNGSRNIRHRAADAWTRGAVNRPTSA